MIAKPYPRRSKRGAAGLLRTRFQFALLLCLMWTGIILLKLFYIQVIQHDHYIARANKQRTSFVPLLPERGPIIDRKGRPLAISVQMTSIYGVPETMKNPAEVFAAVSKYVPINVPELIKSSKNRSFVWIARKISQQTADKIRKQNLPGIYFTQESRRFYPNKDLAAHVVGFVGMDNKGLSGVEHQYDSVVCGVPGKIPALRDAKKRLLFSSTSTLPTVGRTIQLTIDAAIQHIAEEELHAAVKEQNAESGAVIIMNPYTGEILALANEPSFNPNVYKQYSAWRWKNRAIQDYYEPGSTFKPVVASAALDRNLVDPDDEFDCQHGSISVNGHIMKDHKPFGVLTFRQIIQKSSNVGTIKIGMIVGPQSLFQYATAFGFGKRTGIDLPGEAPGIFRPPSRWSAISIGAVSIGQEIGVTPIQVLRMMSAISNGGYLPTPHCVSKISDSSGALKQTVFPQPQALPIRHEAIATLQTFVEAVVDEGGSGLQAEIPGYSVAGKTGTAQVIGASHTYADGGYIASFVGYVPATKPAFAMIALIRGPKKEHYGGRVAAPLFRKIGQQVLKYLDVPPDRIQNNPAIQVASAFPRVNVATLPESIEPVAYTPPEKHHKLVIAADDDKASELVMPSLQGKTAGEAVQMLTKLNRPFRLLGSGTVIKQWPMAGTLLTEDDLFIITLGNSSQEVVEQSDRNVVHK
jgi:cell division protein FtsI (penicillin-binding protein 3)